MSGNTKEYNADYYKKNRERIVAMRKAIRQTKEWKDKMRKYHQKYHLENPHKSREQNRRRRARRLKVQVAPYTEAEVLKTYGKNCHICGKRIDLKAPRKQGAGTKWYKGLHIDHLVAVSKGGPDTLENVRPAHAICNLRKRND